MSDQPQFEVPDRLTEDEEADLAAAWEETARPRGGRPREDQQVDEGDEADDS